MYGFDKTRRLLKKSDYDHVFAQAKKIVSSEFTILYRDNMVGHARLGLAISKKMINKAHDRNRVKRLLREVFRNNPKLPPLDFIMLAKPGMGRVPSSVISAKLNGAWNKISTSYGK